MVLEAVLDACAGKENGPSAGGVLGPLPGLCAGGGPAQLMMRVCNPPTPLNSGLEWPNLVYVRNRT